MIFSKRLLVSILIMVITITIAEVALAESINNKNKAVDISAHHKTKKAENNPYKAMRKLWEDHITYTRNYIISELGNLGDVEAVSKRLLKNQDDIGDAIKPYYGEEAGEKLSSLLRDHILVATEVVKAAKMNDKDGLSTAQKKWQANADEITAFLCGANPNWDGQEMRDMMRKHLELTTGEVVSRLKKDWKADIDFYDKGHEHMLMFSDMLVDGIKKQFPQKFYK